MEREGDAGSGIANSTLLDSSRLILLHPQLGNQKGVTQENVSLFVDGWQPRLIRQSTTPVQSEISQHVLHGVLQSCVKPLMVVRG